MDSGMKIVKHLFLLSLLSLFVAGCASQGNDASMAAADRAQSTAMEAQDAAEDARSMAQQALEAVRRLEEKVDRMFDRALQK